MYNKNKINSLRIEKKLTNSSLNSLQNKLNRGVVNTRKYKADTEKIQKLKNRIIEIDTEIFQENQKLNKLKFANINLDDSPLLRTMTVRTPPKDVSNMIEKSDNLNLTFEPQRTESLTSQSFLIYTYLIQHQVEQYPKKTKTQCFLHNQ